MEQGDKFNFNDISPVDFGEPTPETRARFGQTIDGLKELGDSATGTPLEVLRSAGYVNIPQDILDQLSDITKHTYSQISDKNFPLDSESFLKFIFFDVEPRTKEAWARTVGDMTLAMIYFQDNEVDIQYNLTNESERLFMTRPMPPGISLNSPRLQWILRVRMLDRIQSIQNGADHPTEGSLRQLTEKLELEVQKREK